MYWGLVTIICILLGVIAIQNSRYKKRSKDIQYITNKIDEIMKEESLERVQLVTPDIEIRKLNEVVNELLDYNHKNLVGYNRARTSMKKMLSNVSHDLKTPLTVVLGYLEMLSIQEGMSSEISKVYQKVQRVIKLINSFFDLAKLESGDKVIELSAIDVSECVRKCILTFSTELETSGIEVDVQIPDQELFMQGNEEALSRIMNNLISNAIKYGADGKYLGIVVTKRKDYVEIEVKDRGKGIEKRYQQKVFERLYTLEDSRSEGYQGNGLGLAITKTLVEVLNGDISLRSIPFHETVFEVRFKLIGHK